MEFDQKELMNEYVSNQNKMIGDLINKNLMLESQLAVAFKMIEGLKENKTDDNEDYGIKQNTQEFK